MCQRTGRALARFLASGLLMLAVAIGGNGCSQESGHSPDALSNSTQKAAARPLQDLDGQPIDLHQASHGQIHVVVFVRSDCPISNRIAPEIRELYSMFQPRNVDFFLVYVDPREKPDAIRAHLKEYDYTCQALRDPDHTLVAQVNATVTPETVVFDHDWNVVYQGRINDQFEDFGKSRAMATTHDLRDAIAATIEGKQVAEPTTKAIGCYIDDLK